MLLTTLARIAFVPTASPQAPWQLPGDRKKTERLKISTVPGRQSNSVHKNIISLIRKKEKILKAEGKSPVHTNINKNKN